MVTDLKKFSEELDNMVDREKDKLSTEIDDLAKLIIETTEQARAAAAQGDLRENSDYHNALNNLVGYNSQMIRLTEKLDIIKSIGVYKYNSVGVVLQFSTVKLKCEDGTTYIYKIFPNISMGDYIISDQSRIAKALLQKTVGDVIMVEHSITKKFIKYTIEDIY